MHPKLKILIVLVGLAWGTFIIIWRPESPVYVFILVGYAIFGKPFLSAFGGRDDHKD